MTLVIKEKKEKESLLYFVNDILSFHVLIEIVKHPSAHQLQPEHDVLDLLAAFSVPLFVPCLMLLFIASVIVISDMSRNPSRE